MDTILWKVIGRSQRCNHCVLK